MAGRGKKKYFTEDQIRKAQAEASKRYYHKKRNQKKQKEQEQEDQINGKD